MILENLTEYRNEITSFIYLCWAYIMFSIAAVGSYIVYKKWGTEGHDPVTRFATAMGITGLFEGTLRSWYVLLNVFKAHDYEKLVELMQQSLIPAALGTGIVVGGILQIYVLLTSINKGTKLWKLWIMGFVTSATLLSLYYFYQPLVLQDVISMPRPMRNIE